MKRRTALISLIAIIATIGIAIGASKSIGTAQQPSQSRIDISDVIDGAKTPEKVPDLVAYSLLFRFLSNRQTEVEQNRVRSYIKQMNLGDADALLNVTRDYEQRIGTLDSQAKAIIASSGKTLNSEAIAKLKDLDQQRNEIVADVINSLPSRLGADGAARIRLHINERVKRKIRIVPDQSFSQNTPANNTR